MTAKPEMLIALATEEHCGTAARSRLLTGIKQALHLPLAIVVGEIHRHMIRDSSVNVRV